MLGVDWFYSRILANINYCWQQLKPSRKQIQFMELEIISHKNAHYFYPLGHHSAVYLLFTSNAILFRLKIFATKFNFSNLLLLLLHLHLKSSANFEYNYTSFKGIAIKRETNKLCLSVCFKPKNYFDILFRCSCVSKALERWPKL